MPQKKTSKHIRHFIDKKLIFRLRLFGVIFLVMTGVVIFETFTNGVSPIFGISGIGVGAGIGFILGRIYKYAWNKDETKVVGNLDKIGLVFLAIYILFAIFRSQLFGHFIQGQSLEVFTLGLTAGSMLGRIIFARKGISDLLEAAGVV